RRKRGRRGGSPLAWRGTAGHGAPGATSAGDPTRAASPGGDQFGPRRAQRPAGHRRQRGPPGGERGVLVGAGGAATDGGIAAHRGSARRRGSGGCTGAPRRGAESSATGTGAARATRGPVRGATCG